MSKYFYVRSVSYVWEKSEQFERKEILKKIVSEEKWPFRREEWDSEEIPAEKWNLNELLARHIFKRKQLTRATLEYENGFPSVFHFSTDKRDFIFMNYVAAKRTKNPTGWKYSFTLALEITTLWA